MSLDAMRFLAYRLRKFCAAITLQGTSCFFKCKLWHRSSAAINLNRGRLIRGMGERGEEEEGRKEGRKEEEEEE